MSTRGFLAEGEVSGVVAPPFEGVRNRFASLVSDGVEGGAALCVVVDDTVVVDLVGGWSDVGRTRAWTPGTLVHTYSVGKPFAALALLVLVQDGALTLDMPVADVWPDYAAAGKGATTVRHLLTHQAGLPAFGASLEPNDLLDPTTLVAWLAQAHPEWVPGRGLGEHALTYGHLLAAVVTAVSGRSLGEQFRLRVARPLGWDAWFGVPPDELGRVADLEYASPLWPQDIAGPTGSLRHRALTQPQGALEVRVLNHPRWRQAEFPAIGMHASARGVVALYAQLLTPDGPLAQILGPEVFDGLVEPQAHGWDRTLEREVTWTLGMQRDGGDVGMGGIGGSVGFASLDKGYAFAYVTRTLGDHARVDALVTEVEAALARDRRPTGSGGNSDAG
ncbi:MAG: serine hydrolase domain-containing protein [Actinomycetes bacterium]